MFDRDAMKQILMQVSFVSVLFVVFAMHGMDLQEFDAAFSDHALAAAIPAQVVDHIFDSENLSSSLLYDEQVQNCEDTMLDIPIQPNDFSSVVRVDEDATEAELAALVVRHNYQQDLQPESVITSTKATKRKAVAVFAEMPQKKRQRMVTSAAVKNFFCDDCGRGFTRKGNLTAHMCTHTGEKPFACGDCGRGFTRKDHLTGHMRMHTGEKPFACDDCGKGFARKSSLTRHMCMHKGKKPFACGDCGKGFTQKGHLTEHIRIHTGAKPFACDDCGKRFAQKSNLTKHIYTHTGEKPCACPEAGCGYAAALKTNLKRHLKTQHGITEAAAPADEC